MPTDQAKGQINNALSAISDATAELGGTTDSLESLKRDLAVTETRQDTSGVDPELGIGLMGEYTTPDVEGRLSVRQETAPGITGMEEEQVVDLLGPTFDKDQYLSLTGQYQHRVQRELESVDPTTGRPAFGTPALRQIESGMLAGMPDQYTRWILSRTGTPFGKYLDETGLSRPKDTPLPEYWREIANLGRTYKDLDIEDQGRFMATARQMPLFGVMTSDGSGFTNTLSKEQKWAARSAMGGATSGYLGQINNDRFTALLNAWDTLQVYYPGKYSTPEFLPWVISMLSPGDPGYIEGFVFDPLSGMKTEDKNLGKKIEVDVKEKIGNKENPIISTTPGVEAEKRFDAYQEEALGDVDGLMPPTGLKKQPVPEDKNFVDIGVAGDDPEIAGLQQTITPTRASAFDQYVDPMLGEEGRTPIPVRPDRSFVDPTFGEEVRTPAAVRQRGEISTGFVPQDMAWTGSGPYMGETDLSRGGYGGQPPSGPIPYQAPINPVTRLPLTQAEALANIQETKARNVARDTARAAQEAAYIANLDKARELRQRPFIPGQSLSALYPEQSWGGYTPDDMYNPAIWNPNNPQSRLFSRGEEPEWTDPNVPPTAAPRDRTTREPMFGLSNLSRFGRFLGSKVRENYPQGYFWRGPETY
jgi:hypothetical protein